MTETCYAYGAGYPRDPAVAPPLPRLDFLDGRTWGSRIVSDVSTGVSGWLYWNLMLDMRGGPFLLSPSHGDGEGNWQHAVVHVDADTGAYHLTGLFWCVKPGRLIARRTFSLSSAPLFAQVPCSLQQVRAAWRGARGHHGHWLGSRERSPGGHVGRGGGGVRGGRERARGAAAAEPRAPRHERRHPRRRQVASLLASSSPSSCDRILQLGRSAAFVLPAASITTASWALAV